MSKPAASVNQLFTKFCNSISFQETLQLFTQICSQLGVDSTQHSQIYPSLKHSLKHWKAVSLFQLLDTRAAQLVYEGGKACAGRRALVIGAGPVGLRGAIELALLGARVDLVEKRSEFTRNNCLHLWQFCITDLRNLGAKILYSRFAYGTIQHISIKFLQSILLKICLLLGVQIHSGVSFDSLVEPDGKGNGWRVQTTPEITSLSYDFDTILAADGNKKTLPGFPARVFRPKLALGITVNFVNRNTSKDCAVKEVGGLSVMQCSDVFATLASEHEIELENIVYFKDETHYFVMTAKKTSLLRKGVIKEDNKDVRELLKRSNISHDALASFAERAAISCSGLQNPEVVINHHGEKDIALFDFTTMHECENASRIIERQGKKLLLSVAGDTLLQPFWPAGTGCSRGFLGIFDAAWMFKGFCSDGADMIKLLEKRESILTLLSATNPHNLHADHTSYTIDPKTRYKSLRGITPRSDVKQLYDTDKHLLEIQAQDSEITGCTESNVSHDSSEFEEKSGDLQSAGSLLESDRVQLSANTGTLTPIECVS